MYFEAFLNFWKISTINCTLMLVLYYLFCYTVLKYDIDRVWLQLAFDTLTGLFNQVRLKTNFRKTVCMVCSPCRESRVQTYEAHTKRMAGGGRSFKGRQRERVIEEHHRCFGLGGYFMAAVLSAPSYSRIGFNPCLAVHAQRVMVPGGSVFHLEPGTIHPCWNLTGT